MPTEGQTAINRKTGQRATFRNGQWVVTNQAPADASMRGRLAIGLGPMVDAQSRMSNAEQGGNPLQRDWGASALEALPMGLGSQAAKVVGGQDYQDYTNAAKAFEAQLMPIMSGAAVSPSEAKRQIKAALPELGDSPETLAQKARVRQMMLNGAASSMGAPLPYPDVETFGINTGSAPKPNKAVKNEQLKAKSAQAKAGGGFKILGVEN